MLKASLEACGKGRQGPSFTGQLQGSNGVCEREGRGDGGREKEKESKLRMKKRKCPNKNNLYAS